MRNLKKILALALALVMTLSLMTVANAFNDDKDIDAAYTEAVQVLSGLKVFKGVNDGSTFAPKQTITRGEVAAIIYRIVTGDVNDSKAGLYASYAETSFSDVKSTDWYAGYIGYCSNAGLIKGNGAGRFLPATTVNGYQALAMILRAVGYGQSGEFEGSGWELRTASTAQTLGLLKNVSAGSLGNAASREVVAEILFQAISGTNMVAPNSITGYHDLGYTLGYQTFKLERLEGVVTANEYADLDDSSPLAEGKTRLDNRTLDYSSQLTDIGESRYAYVVGSTVLALADTGRNTVFETGAATDISTAAKFQKATGLKDDAESYLNFADAYSDTYEADIRIVYSVSGTYATDGVSIRAGERLSDDEYNEIRSIFYGEADYEDGWIIVGTSYKDDNTAEENDVSNDMTFRAFVREYLITDSEDAVTVEGSENGEWLKVVDNDGDGTAEYVFKTEFAMSMITDITKKGVYTFASLETADKPAFEADKVAEADIVTSDELAEGDVVIYTKIDGVYYVDLAEMVTETVDKGGVDKRDETITCDGAVYGQSYIGYSDLMESDVTKAHTNETYDLYLDHFGYVRLYQESTYNNGFVLLTDGYYATDKRTDEFQATIFDVDADKLVDVDVAEGKGDTAANTFIDDGTVDGKEEGTWGRLKTFGRGFITNVAAYSVADDVYTLTEVENASNRVTYSAQELAVNVRNGLTARTLETEDGDRVQTTTDTVYYLVITGGKTPEVISWTGYSNAPEDAALDSDAVGYAVTHKGAGSYDVADVVVYETSAVDPYDLHFVYETNSRDEAITIGYDESEEAYVADLEVEVDDQKKIDLINFYNIYNSGDFTLIDEDYAAEGIYAGEVVTGGDVDSRDYVVVAGGSIVDEISFRTNTIKSYVVGYDRNGYYVSDEQIESYEIGDKVILVTGRNDQDVLYVINVTQSVANKAVIKAVDDLYDAIVADANAPKGAEAILFELAKYDEASEIVDEATKTAAETAIANANKYLTDNEDTITAKDKEAIEKAIKAVQTAIESTENSQALDAAKADAEKALKDYVDAVDANITDVPDVTAEDLADVLAQEIAAMQKLDTVAEVNAYVQQTAPVGTGILNIWNEALSIQAAKVAAKNGVARIGDTYYTTLGNAVTAAKAGDEIVLMKHVTETVTIDEASVTLNGNGYNIRGEVVVAADNVVLDDVTVTAPTGIALVVNANVAGTVVEGGSYKNETVGKQGEGAVRFMGSNGNISVTDAEFLGGIHVLNYTSGTLNISGNTFALDSSLTGNGYVNGILVQGTGANAVTVASLTNNTFATGTGNYVILIQGADWTTHASKLAD